MVDPLQLIPWGQLEGGNFGTLIDPGTGQPLAAVVEVMTTLPTTASAFNFPGRLVFQTSDQTLYVFQDDPVAFWFPLEGIPAEVDNVAGVPPVIPVPVEGSLFWDRDTEVLFVWDGAIWQPIGGRFAAQFITVTAPGDGLTTSFAHGVTGTPPTNDLVEAFIDGVRQFPPTDYSVVGPNVVFVTAPAAGTSVMLRSASSNIIAQNAQVLTSTSTAAASQTTFNAGAPSLDPAGTFVFVNGVLQDEGSDYIHQSADTTITGITKVAATTARATTAVAHSAGAGNVVEIDGAAEAEYTGSFTITAIPSTTQFEFTVAASAPASATPDPLIFYNPPFVNDDIIFTAPLPGGEKVVIRSIKSVVTAPSTGEANTASNLGSGEGVFSTKSGVDLRFKSLAEGSNINLIDLGNEIQINAATGALFEDRSGINTATYDLSASDSYVGVRNTTLAVTINLATGVTLGAAGSGRRVAIKDESGGASINSITIIHAGATFDGAANHVISTNYGAVILVFDGTDWFIEAEKI